MGTSWVKLFQRSFMDINVLSPVSRIGCIVDNAPVSYIPHSENIVCPSFPPQDISRVNCTYGRTLSFLSILPMEQLSDFTMKASRLKYRLHRLRYRLLFEKHDPFLPPFRQRPRHLSQVRSERKSVLHGHALPPQTRMILLPKFSVHDMIDIRVIRDVSILFFIHFLPLSE